MVVVRRLFISRRAAWPMPKDVAIDVQCCFVARSQASDAASVAVFMESGMLLTAPVQALRDQNTQAQRQVRQNQKPNQQPTKTSHSDIRLG